MSAEAVRSLGSFLGTEILHGLHFIDAGICLVQCIYISYFYIISVPLSSLIKSLFYNFFYIPILTLILFSQLLQLLQGVESLRFAAYC